MQAKENAKKKKKKCVRINYKMDRKERFWKLHWSYIFLIQQTFWIYFTNEICCKPHDKMGWHVTVKFWLFFYFFNISREHFHVLNQSITANLTKISRKYVHSLVNVLNENSYSVLVRQNMFLFRILSSPTGQFQSHPI